MVELGLNFFDVFGVEEEEDDNMIDAIVAGEQFDKEFNLELVDKSNEEL